MVESNNVIISRMGNDKTAIVYHISVITGRRICFKYPFRLSRNKLISKLGQMAIIQSQYNYTRKTIFD